jgi:Pentapeptide repeats (8 copies)
MANDEHVEMLKKGVAAWNDWRKKNPNIEPDLRDAYLNYANLGGANLSGAWLDRAEFRGAYLGHTSRGGFFLGPAQAGARRRDGPDRRLRARCLRVGDEARDGQH